MRKPVHALPNQSCDNSHVVICAAFVAVIVLVFKRKLSEICEISYWTWLTSLHLGIFRFSRSHSDWTVVNLLRRFPSLRLVKRFSLWNRAVDSSSPPKPMCLVQIQALHSWNTERSESDRTGTKTTRTFNMTNPRWASNCRGEPLTVFM